MKIWPNLQHGTEQWFRIRKGRVTASNADRVLTPTGKDSSQWESYALDLTTQCIRPDEIEPFAGNKHTDRGNELEPFAREEFTRLTGLNVVAVGFCTVMNDVVGFSPDALVLREGLTPETWTDHAVFDDEGAIINGLELIIGGLECKAPLSKIHGKYLLNGGVPADYDPQVHFSMAASGLPWWFTSFCPRLKTHLHKQEPTPYTIKMRDAIERFVVYYGAKRSEWMPKLLGKEEG